MIARKRIFCEPCTISFARLWLACESFADFSRKSRLFVCWVCTSCFGINSSPAPKMLTKQKLRSSLELLKRYEWLLNSYVMDFYVDDHWSKLPDSWQHHLESIPMERFEALLYISDSEAAPKNTSIVWPLELLALRGALRNLCIGRTEENQPKESFPCPLLHHPKLKHLFMKRVKPKKQHEITRMAEICALSCRTTPVDFVVDFGAGVGHLARILGYGFGIQVCCFEMQAELNQQAVAIDMKLESIAAKLAEASGYKRPVHLTQRLESNTEPAQFIAGIRDTLQLASDDFRFGIIGLHPCGNLGATLMRMFLGCSQAKFLNFVGCCYQKMSTPATHPGAEVHGYPLSSFLQSKPDTDTNLSYEAREISCHAMEVYRDRLQAGQYDHLKIHSFRAAAERMIVQQFPHLRHCALRNVKHAPGMLFDDYFQKAVQGTRFEMIERQVLSIRQCDADVQHWKRLVIFYTLRLMLAPLVESIILYDRALFLSENDCQVEVQAIFNPRLSPRNHITRAVKTRRCLSNNLGQQ
ncbi:protein RRNAD1 isoform X1 [Drosophila pseudoobscura]|uniref:Protein RRNAD1 isoform X1 n=2 Tax=Drosophila pseudoobscura pseudoobscura TaxID=46245 RepID=A0A6I8UU34_DROPS|nr:protein RRNAD1 isoform X1 [Drosophila pseudoobscura]